MPTTFEEKKDVLTRSHRMMALYTDSTKTYFQLSSAGLALCVFRVGENAQWQQLLAWFAPCFLWMCCMIAASIYQVAAAKWLERLEVEKLGLPLGYTPRDGKTLRGIEIGPGDAFRLMIGLFYAGVLAFLIVAGILA